MPTLVFILSDPVRPESPNPVTIGGFTHIDSHGWSLYLGTPEEYRDEIRLAGDSDTGGMLYTVDLDGVAHQYRTFAVEPGTR